MSQDELLQLIAQAAAEGWTELDLAGHNLTELPPEIGQLVNLKKLSLRSNQLSALPHEIGKLTSLQELSLSYNQLSSLPTEIGRLTNLYQLTITSNKITILPPSIGQLVNLKELYISDNRLIKLPPEIGQLANLQHLSVSYNQLDTIPLKISQINNLKKLDIRFNKNLKNLPPEIASQGTVGILNYFRQQLNQGQDYMYEAKLLILGEGGAGKTSLAKKIIDKSYVLDLKEQSTEGINVLRWSFDLRNDTKFDVNIWDFGGQEIYHETHQFFLTKRSLYALVVDTRQENTDLYYWLSIVNLLGDNSPVIVIKNEKQDRICNINERQLRGEFDNLKAIFSANLMTNRGLGEVQSEIQRYISDLPHIGTRLPRKWVNVRRILESDNRNYISVDKYYRICDSNGFNRREDQLQLSDYLHDLGVCLHFQKDPLLKKTIILKPEWGTSAVYKVLENKKVQNNYGCFTRTQINDIWSDNEYRDMRDELLQLMMRFKLCYQIPGTTDQYIAPQLLEINQPPYDWDDSQNLWLRYNYEFMPKGILTRFIVEMHKFIEAQTLVWKTGVVLTNGSARAEVIELYYKGEIQIRAAGVRLKELLTVVSYEIDKINDSYERIQVKKLIPCNCQTCAGSQDPHFYELNKLQERIDNRKPTIECGKPPYEDVPVQPLIGDFTFEPMLFPWEMESDEDEIIAQDRAIEHEKTVWPTQTLAPEVRQEIYISYAWSGESETIINKIDAAFQGQDITLIRDKNQLGYKGNIQAFMEQIGRGKAVIVMISDKYLRSENCMFELVEIAANGKFYDRVFPIVLPNADIYKPVKRLQYIQHWENEIAELDQALKTVGAANMQGFRESIDLYTRIRAAIAELVDTFKNMNTLTPERHTDSEFAELFEAVRKRLDR
jgi:Leucine-rich repeat (LRR) protein